jgi:hypothetical protein
MRGLGGDLAEYGREESGLANAVTWAALGNLVGGVALVTMLRLVQVGRDTLDDERGRTE